MGVHGGRSLGTGIPMFCPQRFLDWGSENQQEGWMSLTVDNFQCAKQAGATHLIAHAAVTIVEAE